MLGDSYSPERLITTVAQPSGYAWAWHGGTFTGHWRRDLDKVRAPASIPWNATEALNAFDAAHPLQIFDAGDVPLGAVRRKVVYTLDSEPHPAIARIDALIVRHLQLFEPEATDPDVFGSATPTERIAIGPHIAATVEHLTAARANLLKGNS